eukprot:Hpha_TRINITY_DN29851_c0_g1::TRINITY_DN29851_c0_g1_i1::g.2867::m.2867/K12850/PRPF38B; pre-mRNA-splicing factor 38B
MQGQIDPLHAAHAAQAAHVAQAAAAAAAAAQAAGLSPYVPLPGPREELTIWDGCDSRTMNLEWALHHNVTDSDYFQSLTKKGQVGGVQAMIEECREEVDCCAAWTEGGRALGHHFAPIVIGRGAQVGKPFPGAKAGQTNNSIRGCTAKHQGQAPSRLWCILLRLFQLRPSEEQVRGLLLPTERPTVRALGILFVRLTQHPSRYMEFLEDCARDEHHKLPLTRSLPGRQGEVATIADFVRMVILEQKCLETVLPRVPERFLRELRSSLTGDSVEDTPAAAAASRRGVADGGTKVGDTRGGAKEGGVVEGARKQPDDAPRKRKRLGRLGELDDREGRSGGSSLKARGRAESPPRTRRRPDSPPTPGKPRGDLRRDQARPPGGAGSGIQGALAKLAKLAR